MDYEPISGKPVRFPPGRVQIRFDPEHRRSYRALYSRYQSILAGLPVLSDRDVDGRTVTVTVAQLEALNCALESVAADGPAPAATAFAFQEAGRSRLFKRIQYLS